jgi:hypothetical protein
MALANATAFTSATRRASTFGGSTGGLGVNSGTVDVGRGFPGAQKVSRLRDQSINGLYLASQLYPSTTEQEVSSGVTKNVIVISSPVLNHTGRSTADVIAEREVPSKRRSGIGGISYKGRFLFFTRQESIKQ